MAIKRLKNATSAKTSDSNKPVTIDREEMKRRLGKAKKTASAKQTSPKASPKKASAKRASAKKTSAKVDAKVDAAETKAMDLRTMQTGMEQMLTMLMNMSKEYAVLKDRVSELEDSVTERINNVVGMVKHQAEQVDELYDYVTENLDEDGDEDCDEDEYEADDDDDAVGDEVGDDCEEDCGEDDCEEEEEDGDDCEEDDCEDEDCDEGEEEGDDEEDMDLDPANYTPEEVMDILSEFDDADLKELVSEVKERLGLVRNYSLKTLLKDETRRGVILQVINDFAYNDEEDDEDE